MKKQALFLCLQIVFLCSLGTWQQVKAETASTAETKFYILEKPIIQNVKNGPISLSMIVGGEMTWIFGAVSSMYLATGDLISSGLYLGYQLSMASVPLTVNSRALLLAKAQLRNRSTLKSIAQEKSIRKIITLTTADVQYLGMMSKHMHSKTLVIVQATPGELATHYKGSKWIPVDPTAKIRLQLNINGINHFLPYIEINFSDFIKHSTLSAKETMAWKKTLKEWKKKIPWWDRYFLHRQEWQALSISSSIVFGSQEIKMGELAAGPQVTNILEGGNVERILRLLKNTINKNETVSKERKLKLRHYNVYDKNNKPSNCMALFRRFLGLDFIRR